MSQRLEQQIRTLRALFWSDRDPEGRAFAPLADAYLRFGDPAQALELVVEGLDRHPDFASGHLVAGRVFRETGDPESASLAFDRVLQLDPENTVALLTRAELAAEAGDRTGALARYLRLDALSPGDPRVEDRVRALEAEAGALDAVDAPVGEAAGSGGEEVVAGRDAVVREPAPRPAEPVASTAKPESPSPPDRDEEEVGEAPEVHTRTMAELYARQGFPDRALAILRHLAQYDPEDTTLTSRITELEASLPGGGQRPDTEGAPAADGGGLDREDAGDLGDPESWAIPNPGPGADPPTDGLDDGLLGDDDPFDADPRLTDATLDGDGLFDDDDPIDAGPRLTFEPGDSLGVVPENEDAVEDDDPFDPTTFDGDDSLEDVPMGSDPTDDDEPLDAYAAQWMLERTPERGTDSPFTWDPEEETGDEAGESEAALDIRPDDASEPSPDRTGRDYLQDLLAWVPGAVPIESLAPAAVPQDSGVAPSPSGSVPSESAAGEPDGAGTPVGADPPTARPDPEDDDFQAWLNRLGK